MLNGLLQVLSMNEILCSGMNPRMNPSKTLAGRTNMKSMINSRELYLESKQDAPEPCFAKHELPRLAGGPQVTLYYGYRRWLEFDPSGSYGQDFFAIRADECYVVGVVADGVSQSFFGDLAAKAVGTYVIDILWRCRREPLAKEQIEVELHGLEGRVNELVQSREIRNPNSILGQALEKTRAKGSQTVFTAFVLDVHNRAIVLYQVGDVAAWLYKSDRSYSFFSADRLGRWSSAGQSQLALALKNEKNVVGVLLHSDGVRLEWAERSKRPDVSEEDFLEEVNQRASVDDMAFIAVKVSGSDGPTKRSPSRPLSPAI